MSSNSFCLRYGGLTIFFIALLFVPVQAEKGSPGSSYSGTIRLNESCKLKRMSNGNVIVFVNSTEGVENQHQFTDFYADLILAAYRKQRVEWILENLSKKYDLSDSDCRRELKHAVNVLCDWKILYRDTPLAMR